MDDVERRAAVVAELVRGVEPLEDVVHDRGDDAGGEVHTARLRLLEEDRERDALDVLHDEEELATASRRWPGSRSS